MKKFILAAALGMVAISVHAADPAPKDFNVKLAGEVPSQDVFEVSPVGWESGQEIQAKIPDGWTGNWVGDAAELHWNAKSSYGAIRMSVAVDRDEWVLRGKNGESLKLGYRVHRAGVPGWQYLGSDGVIASKERAAAGDWVGIKATLGSDNPPKPGVYTGGLSVVFETGIEG
ncbi:hypothetical protein LGN35_19615 [Burkholderia multivorans]|nr:hypothetical protein [Burkholderia multivorans]